MKLKQLHSPIGARCTSSLRSQGVVRWTYHPNPNLVLVEALVVLAVVVAALLVVLVEALVVLAVVVAILLVVLVEVLVVLAVVVPPINNTRPLYHQIFMHISMSARTHKFI